MLLKMIGVAAHSADRLAAAAAITLPGAFLEMELLRRWVTVPHAAAAGRIVMESSRTTGWADTKRAGDGRRERMVEGARSVPVRPITLQAPGIEGRPAVGQLLVVRRTIAIVAVLFFVDAGINADLHMFGFAMAALSVLLALPIVFPARNSG